MYATYTTEALVCGSKDSYTSDRSYLLFSKEAGMLWATARSVREERSKQRYALQDFSLLRASLVKGRSGWKVGSVEAIGNPFLEARTRGERAYVKNVIGLLRRYIHGEQAVLNAYLDTRRVLESVPAEIDRERLFMLYSARLLYILGYISKNEANKALFETDNILIAYKKFVPDLEIELDKTIAQAHQLSHL